MIQEQGRHRFLEMDCFTGFLRLFVFVTKKDNSEMMVQMLRGLANLSFNCDSNRDRMVGETEALSAVVGYIVSKDEQVSYTACGCLLNLSMDNEPMQTELVKLASAQEQMAKEPYLHILFDFVDYIAPYEEGEVTYQTTRLEISKTVTNITMCDSIMHQLANDANLVAKMKQWMSSGLDSMLVREEEMIRMAGALCIGNLARSGIEIDDR
ncbi:hypothetical protein EDD86DRAFT_215794 [Gorgonomyces haynaldii]|nr:hypothetical protein EDD86DRAFT_215794 [Gorgonomyces haynaldii]